MSAVRHDPTASPRLFENDLLDRLSRVDPRLPLIVYSPVVIALLVWSPWRGASLALAAGSFIIGYALWTLTEYLGHRFLFHVTFPGRIGARISFLLHGVHHDHPSDPLRLVMPVLMSLPIIGIALLVALAIFPISMQAPGLAGFIAGYVAYDTLHYLLHHSRSRHPLFLRLKRLHMLHHFNDHTKGFGVAAPWWDSVFRTQFPQGRD